jgi:hypothetical protein
MIGYDRRSSRAAAAVREALSRSVKDKTTSSVATVGGGGPSVSRNKNKRYVGDASSLTHFSSLIGHHSSEEDKKGVSGNKKDKAEDDVKKKNKRRKIVVSLSQSAAIPSVTCLFLS